MWIGITGPAQSGKDTVYGILKDIFGNKCQRFSFADKLKDSACTLLNISREQLEGLKIFDSVKFRLILDEDWGGPIDYCYPDDDIMVEPFTMRTFLQRYGTEAHRNIFGKDFWVEQLFKNVPDDNNMLFVITDVRFDNEAKAIKDRKGFVIRLTRNGTGNMKHASEVPIDMDLVDVVIINDGSIEDLKNNILNVVKNNWISCE
ncbi:MAG: hypothetical protein M0Q12_06035 [Synergistaceae bacterium]|jgi:hypothetical protein|nr:hypothetical protein [Synergistaceae bacterium]